MYIPEGIVGFICGFIVAIVVIVLIGATAGKKK